MQVVNRGGMEALILDAAAHTLNKAYGDRVAAHEAGHFLVAYLLGLLPKRYTVSALDAFQKCALAVLPVKILRCSSVHLQRCMSACTWLALLLPFICSSASVPGASRCKQTVARAGTGP